MVLQSYALYPHLDGFDNLGHTFRAQRRPPQEAIAHILITVEFKGVGFQQFLQHKPGHLAGGDQQRLADGRALLREPAREICYSLLLP